MSLASRVIFLILILCGCASLVQSRPNLSYDAVRELTIGKTDSLIAFEILGPPNSRIKKDGFLSVEYLDGKTEVQRLILNFDSTSNKLLAVFWFPKEGDPESKIAYATNIFPKAKFEVVTEKTQHPHFLTSDQVQYVDRNSGVTITGSLSRSTVESITMSAPDERSLAEKD